VGCVRSGTTLLRDILRQHVNLCCPEETQFFRWGNPFRTKEFVQTYTSSPVLRRHREIDGVAEEEYLEILATSTSRGMFMRRYLELFQRAQHMEDRRVFDKSPQNIYGIPLIKDAFPQARFISMVRNPLNVVASLREGKVMHVADLVGACSYWNEAVSILNFFTSLIPDDLYVVRYEDLIKEAPRYLHRILQFVGEENVQYRFSLEAIRPERNQYLTSLSAAEVVRVHELCARGMHQFGYTTGSLYLEPIIN
jgi:hypothetical protein